MIFWLSSQIFENALFPVPLHLIPIFNLTMFDRVVQVVSFRVCECFITDVKVEVVDTSFRGQVTG